MLLHARNTLLLRPRYSIFGCALTRAQDSTHRGRALAARALALRAAVLALRAAK
jgi:hypothetical protein